MAEELILLASIAWLTAGFIGGIILDGTERIDPFAWPMAMALGPFTLFLGLWERRIRRKRGHHG